MGSVTSQVQQVEDEVEESDTAGGATNQQEVEEVEESDGGGPWMKQGKGSKKVKYICRGGKKVCGQSFVKGEESVGCDLCDEWFHPRCIGMSIEAFRALHKYQFIWLCDSCKPNFMDVIKLGKKIETKIEDVKQEIMAKLEASTAKGANKGLEEKIVTMEKTIAERIREQQKEVENAVKMQKEVAQTIPKLQTELRKSTQDVKKFVEKKEESAKREVNIIIHNIPECESSDPSERKEYDVGSFHNIADALLEGNNMEVSKIFRLGKKPEVKDGEGEPKPRLLLVGLKKKEDVDALMSKRWNLKDVGFSNIYLTRDQTPEEREIQRKLREELSEKGRGSYRIFRGKVVPKQQ